MRKKMVEFSASTVQAQEHVQSMHTGLRVSPMAAHAKQSETFGH